MEVQPVARSSRARGRTKLGWVDILTSVPDVAIASVLNRKVALTTFPDLFPPTS